MSVNPAVKLFAMALLAALASTSVLRAADIIDHPLFGKMKLIDEIDCTQKLALPEQKPAPEGEPAPEVDPGPEGEPGPEGRALPAGGLGPAGGPRPVPEPEPEPEGKNRGKKKVNPLVCEIPRGGSKVETILGRPCRVLPNDSNGNSKLFGYRIGVGKNLKPGACYVLSVEYPEDTGRTTQVLNYGADTIRGFHTGATVGDQLHGHHTESYPESLKIPLSGKYEKWQSLFYLHDRSHALKKVTAMKTVKYKTEVDGFWVVFAQWIKLHAPFSAGVAVSRIQLFEVLNPTERYATINFPPAELPRRHVFWREEMSDSVVFIHHSEDGKKARFRGVANPIDWYEYKMKLSKFLGINTFSKDLLEFGANQCWDSTPHGGQSWVYMGSNPGLWGKIIDLAAKYDMSVVPYYEYTGSKGGKLSIGFKRLCEPLRKVMGKKEGYTRFAHCESANADITDPATLEDVKKIFDCTILRYKDKVNFLGAWFRTRYTDMPISYSMKTIARFAGPYAEENLIDPEEITSDLLLADKEVLKAYMEWWYERRKVFLTALADYLRENGVKDARIFLTPVHDEPGVGLRGPRKGVKYVYGKKKGQLKPHWLNRAAIPTDDVAGWNKVLEGLNHYVSQHFYPFDFNRVIDEDMYLKALTFLGGPNHSTPGADTHRYTDQEKVIITHGIHRIYSASSPKTFKAFQTKAGVAVVRHHTLNENGLAPNRFSGSPIGYIISDVERAGPYCMATEVRAVANGDPRYFGYSMANNYARGFPKYVRAFNLAYLSLPAVSSTVVKGASSDPEVIVREYKTDKHGTWYAVANIGLTGTKGVKLVLPAKGKLFDSATGEELKVAPGAVTLDMHACELRAFQVRPQ